MLTGCLGLNGGRLNPVNPVNPVKKYGVFRFAVDERPSSFSPSCVSQPASLQPAGPCRLPSSGLGPPASIFPPPVLLSPARPLQTFKRSHVSNVSHARSVSDPLLFVVINSLLHPPAPSPHTLPHFRTFPPFRTLALSNFRTSPPVSLSPARPFKRSNSQTLKPSNPQTLKPSNPEPSRMAAPPYPARRSRCAARQFQPTKITQWGKLSRFLHLDSVYESLP